MSFLERLFDAQLSIFGQLILWREIVGNGFGFASAIGGLRRRVWAWPVGIVGNVLLFTVFFGVAFATPQHETLYGQAGRQVFFIITSVYGWWRWSQIRKQRSADAPAITPRWATATERLQYLVVWVGGVRVNPLIENLQVEKTRNLIKKLEVVAGSHNCSLSEVALSWVVHCHGDIILAIPGATKKEHVYQNIGALTLKLSPEEMNSLDKESLLLS